MCYVTVRVSTTTGEMMIVLTTKKPDSTQEQIVRELLKNNRAQMLRVFGGLLMIRSQMFL